MSSLYVLQLEGGKYYVGKTDDVQKRFQQHMNQRGSAWTKEFSPVKIVETRPITSSYDETNVTKDYMKKYGIENVRGGAYCNVDLTEEQESVIRHELRSNDDKCYKCGRKGHFANRCPNGIEGDNEVIVCGDCEKQFASNKSFDNHYCKPKKQSYIPKTQSGKCYRCGRSGHYANQCYAKSTVDGDDLDSDDED